ncbi:plasmid partitioning protein RepB [Methylocystis sp. ATCC 49242]|uniref:plasmid partitioning protein RepB n=1 Tax=Methylocystis sp. ATCC 49242 TaxID=622637 RepID=UPI0001F884BE|nr:plasmid partitioning protein RepB [Methylocystis sp. ATCC 49242]
MRGRDALRELLGVGAAKETATPPAPHKVSGAVKAMNLGLQRLSEDAAAAKALRETLAAGEQVVELDPALVDSSFIKDRLPLEDDPAFLQLKDSIAVHGQQVPILARPHPSDPGRFQVAFGHRRLTAARELGTKIRAVVKALSDADLVIAQGQENSQRSDLSFIERAMFAARLDRLNFSRETICASLGVDMPEASRLLFVANAVDETIVEAIGPAPKAGRPRWLALAQRFADGSWREKIARVVVSDEFRRADSNGRFNLVFAAAQEPVGAEAQQRQSIISADGRQLGWLERTKKGARLVSEDAAFADFLLEKLDSLRREFETQASE